MISELKRAKFTHYFEVMDMDDDGQVTKQDFLSSADKVIEVLQLDRASIPAQMLTASYAQTWDALVSDLDAKDAMTVDGWIEHFYQLGMDEKQLEAYVTGRAYAILQLFDTDHDQHISKEEWSLFFRTIGHSERHYEMGFQKLDRDHDSQLTKDDIKTAAREFFRSDDPEAPGNWLFGDYTPHLPAKM